MNDLKTIFSIISKKYLIRLGLAITVLFSAIAFYNINQFIKIRENVINHTRNTLSYQYLSTLDEQSFLNSLQASTKLFEFEITSQDNARDKNVICSPHNCYQLNFTPIILFLSPYLLIPILFIFIILILFILIQKSVKQVFTQEINNIKSAIDNDIDLEKLDVVSYEAVSIIQTIAESKTLKNQVSLAKEISHDMKVPIEALKFSLSREPINKSIIEHSLQKLDKLQQDIICFNSEQNETFNLRDCLNHIISDIKETHSLDIAINGNCDLFFTGNKNSFSRAIKNILYNSSEAPQVSSINITINDHPNGVTIRIKDNGKGFPELVLDHFGKKQITYQKKNGTGIGLLQIHKAFLHPQNLTSSKIYNDNGAVYEIHLSHHLTTPPN
jgi:signal transduction histidine kinase